MAVTRNIVVGISDINNEPDVILFRSTENNEDILIQVVTPKVSVKYQDIVRATTTVKDFIDKREPIEIDSPTVMTIMYGEN